MSGLTAGAEARGDARVIALDGRNIRTFQAAELPEAIDLITVDVSFISLSRWCFRYSPRLLQPRGRVVALVKPQFSWNGACRSGGIVRDSLPRAGAVPCHDR